MVLCIGWERFTIFKSQKSYQLDFNAQQFPALGIILDSLTSSLDTTAYAVFCQATCDLSECWSLTLGDRFSWEEKEISLIPDTIPVGSAQAKEDWNEATPKVMLEYGAESGIYDATYATGFKSGGFAYPFIGGLTDVPVKAETWDMFKREAKLEFFECLVRFNTLNSKYTDYDSATPNDYNASVIPGPVVGASRTFGVDVSL